MKSEKQIEASFIEKLRDLKYIYREDIRDKAALEANFKEHFERLNRVKLGQSEFARLRDSIITADVFTAAKTLREMNTFRRDDDTPLQYTLVNIKDWCKNEFEVINQLRINTDNSNHRYDVIILINGVPVVQVELKSLQITPKRAMEQIVEYKNDIGNGYANSLLCFMQLFIVSNETKTYYFANNHKEHFYFDADERFLPIYEFADEKNKKISNLYDFSDDFLPKCTLGQLISRYMVLVVSEQKLMIMRPYQIYAVKAIMDCIAQNRGNGYIWHTTGNCNGKITLMGSTGQIGYCDLAEYKGSLILVARVGANAGQVNFFSGECGVTDNTLVIIIKNHLVVCAFLYNWLDNFNLNKLVFGSGQPLITGGQIKNLALFLPQKKEQEKIADCLSNLDSLITAQAEKIEALKLHKKGLMQGLFVSSEGENE